MDHFYKNSEFGEDWFTFPHFYSELVQALDNDSHIVEVGSWKGKSAAFLAVEILNSGKKIKFDCVDTWLGSPNEQGHQDDPLVKQDQLYDLFLKNIEPVKHIITPIRNTSVEASKLYNDNSLDVVFIDACHDYECVRDDIKAWLPKIKPNSIICGHDITWPSVLKAIREAFGDKLLLNYNESVWLYKKE